MFENAVIILNALAQHIPYAAGLTVFFAEWLIWVLVGLIAVFLFWPALVDTTQMRESHIRNGAKQLIFVLGTAAIAWGIAHLLKIGFGVPRPFVALDVIQPLFEHSANGAFPSGHTTVISALGTALLLMRYTLGWWVLAGALLTGTARVAAGVHWPLDIAGGLLLGGITAVCVVFLYRRFWSGKFGVL